MNEEGEDSSVPEPESQSQEKKKETLISAVRMRKILYDCGSVSNRNKFLKEQCWDSVAREVQETGMYILQQYQCDKYHDNVKIMN